MKNVNKNVAYNTIILYGRMIFNMLIGLYTSRVILEILGVVDFGIYNVVGGVMGMFMFLNSSLSGSVQRFFSFNIGEGNKEKICQVFGSSFILHIILGVLIILCAETFGVWFVNNYLNFPDDRHVAVMAVFQLTISSAFFTVLQIPYLALLIANEKFSYYAYVSMGEAVLKLILILMLPYLSSDKLITYAFFMFLVSLSVTVSYAGYCLIHFRESHYLTPHKTILKNLLGFLGIFVLSPFSWMTIRQGFNILLNIFYGPVVNASRAIASQIDNAVSGVVINLRTAMNPQIVKLYASGDFEHAKRLTFEGAKFSFFLLSIIAFPIILEIRFVLNLWLVNVPEYATVFCQLVLINSLLQNFDGSFDILFQATGKIKANYIYTNIVYLMFLPISYLVLKNSYCAPTIVFCIQIVTTIIAGFVVKIMLLKKVLEIPFRLYYSVFLKPVLCVLLVVIPITLLVTHFLYNDIVRFVMATFLSSVLHIISIYFFGISKEYKYVLKAKIQMFFIRIT